MHFLKSSANITSKEEIILKTLKELLKILSTVFWNDQILRMVKEVAAITGGTSGLGKACVERFVKEGYQVSIIWLNTIGDHTSEWNEW